MSIRLPLASPAAEPRKAYAPMSDQNAVPDPKVERTVKVSPGACSACGRCAFGLGVRVGVDADGVAVGVGVLPVGVSAAVGVGEAVGVGVPDGDGEADGVGLGVSACPVPTPKVSSPALAMAIHPSRKPPRICPITEGC